MSGSVLAKIILKPLSKVYGAVTGVRNKMFDWGVLPQREFDVPVVVVGNLAAGGTGKTPHVEYIVNLLRQTRRVGVLSHGYKRATKGFVLATDNTTPRDIGDESYMMYHKFGGEIMVAVCEKRVNGINKMLEIDPKLDVIVLDDAFQHRYVKPRVSILLTEYERPAFEDEMLPYGRLRESVHNILRADIVIATKCPSNIKPIEYSVFDSKLNLYPAQHRFFSRLRYERLKPVFPELAPKAPKLSELTGDDRLLAVCGIGNPKPFIKHLKSFAAKVRINIYPDHHEYTRKDMEVLTNRFSTMDGDRRMIVTTEKDAVRLRNCPYFPHELKPYLYYLPIRIEFINKQQTVNPSAEARALSAAKACEEFNTTLNKLLTQKSIMGNKHG